MLDLGHAAPSQRVMHHGRLMEAAQIAPRPTTAESGSPTVATPVAGDWRPPVVKTIALRGDGVPELVRAIDDHRQYLVSTHELARRNRIRLANELEHVLRDELMNRLLLEVDQARLVSLMAQLADRELDPYTAARQLMAGGNHV
jgi:LAO/AO transport system kinase